MLLLAGIFVILSGCQKEITEIIDPPEGEVFKTNTPVSDLIQRTSLNDGSFDNIIDGSSCTLIKLPISVMVNGQEILLESPKDFNKVEKIIDESDDDKVVIAFPITVILADYSEITLNSESDLEDLVDECVENGYDDDIECVDFKYPLEIATYDSENQISNVITINNDKELHDFMDDLDDDEFASFNFPLTVTLSDGAEMTINNNDELEEVLENAIDDCDEDDDNDYNDDDIDDKDFRDALLSGEWIISYFFDDEDETDDFEGYVLTFLESGKVKAQKGDEIIEGDWESDGSDGSLELEIDFDDDSLLDELDDDWDVLAYDENQIVLGEDDSESERLELKKK
jgi:hypothetical protein